MSAAIEDNQKSPERRTFPRIEANCPVLYRLKSRGRWIVARLENYSATGLRMICDENLPDGAEIAIQIKPGSIKTIPHLSAEGEVVRCCENEENRFQVSCKIVKVMRNP